MFEIFLSVFFISHLIRKVLLLSRPTKQQHIFFLNLTYDILFNIFRRDRVEGDGENEGSVEDEEEEEEEVEEAVRGGGRKDYRISLICVLCDVLR